MIVKLIVLTCFLGGSLALNIDNPGTNNKPLDGAKAAHTLPATTQASAPSANQPTNINLPGDLTLDAPPNPEPVKRSLLPQPLLKPIEVVPSPKISPDPRSCGCSYNLDRPCPMQIQTAIRPGDYHCLAE